MKRPPLDAIEDHNQALEDLDELVNTKFQDLILNMSMRQLLPLMRLLNDEVERRIAPPILH